jgi:hypothetical protein
MHVVDNYTQLLPSCCARHRFMSENDSLINYKFIIVMMTRWQALAYGRNYNHAQRIGF